MPAESVHSVADTINQLLLIIGKRQARQPDRLHQFGYGRSRYFYSFVVAMMTFAMGSVFALCEGYRQLTNPTPLTALWVAIVIVVAALLEAYILRNARMESKPLRVCQLVAFHPQLAHTRAACGTARGQCRADWFCR